MAKATLLPDPKKLSCSIPALKLKPTPDPPRPAPRLKFPANFSSIFTFKSSLLTEPGSLTSSISTPST